MQNTKKNMKIEELHETLKKKYKKYVDNIERKPCFLGFGPTYKEFFITTKDLIINILQVGRKKCFEVYIQDNMTGEGVTISTKMDGSKVIDLVELVLGT